MYKDEFRHEFYRRCVTSYTFHILSSGQFTIYVLPAKYVRIAVKMSSRTRRDLTLFEKNELLKKYDALGKMSQTAAAGKLGVAQSMLSKLLKSRYEIETSMVNNEQSSRKRKRDGKDPEVEEALKRWFVSVRDKEF